MSSRWRGRFEGGDDDPMAAMATLVDVMLVFACGLMAALVLGQEQVRASPRGGTGVDKTRELPSVPQGVGEEGGGYRAVGRVFRDPKTGKLVLVESNQATNSIVNPISKPTVSVGAR